MTMIYVQLCFYYLHSVLFISYILAGFVLSP